MPVFVGHNHLLYNLINILVGVFQCAIHLWSIQRRVVVLNLELHAEFSDHSIIEIGTIIHDDSLGDSISAEKIMFYEPGTTFLVTEANEASSIHFVK